MSRDTTYVDTEQAAQYPGSSESSPVPNIPARARASSAGAAPRDARKNSNATPTRPAINNSPSPGDVASGSSAANNAPRATSPDPLDDLLISGLRRRDPREGYLQQRWSSETQIRAPHPPSRAPQPSRPQSVTRGPLHIATSARPARVARDPSASPASPAAPASERESPATPGSSRSARRLVSAFASVRRLAMRSTPELLSVRAARADGRGEAEMPLLARHRGGRSRRRSSSFSVASGGDEQTFQ